MFVETSGEVSDGHEFVFKLCFGSKVFELIDVLLESIIGGPVFILSQSLEKSGYVTAHLHLGVEGVKVLVMIHYDFFKHFLFGFDRGIGHLVIPLF